MRRRGGGESTGIGAGCRAGGGGGSALAADEAAAWLPAVASLAHFLYSCFCRTRFPPRMRGPFRPEGIASALSAPASDAGSCKVCTPVCWNPVRGRSSVLQWGTKSGAGRRNPVETTAGPVSRAPVDPVVSSPFVELALPQGPQVAAALRAAPAIRLPSSRKKKLTLKARRVHRSELLSDFPLVFWRAR